MSEKAGEIAEAFIKIHPSDNVAVALQTLPAGMTAESDGKFIVLREEIPCGHKFALTAIAAGQSVIKYGSRIGFARMDIADGSWVHTHNLITALDEEQEYSYHPERTNQEYGYYSERANQEYGCHSERKNRERSSRQQFYFQGYRRVDGRAGVRNEIWIIPTVGCVNKAAQEIERKAQCFVCGTVEAVVAFSHPYGCSQMGEDQENTRRILGQLASHPNAGGVLVLGLGCENSNIRELKSYIEDCNSPRLRFLEAQECEDEIEEGLRLVKELADYAGSFHREPILVSELVVGLKCGGSDGLSGITANPAVGQFTDKLTVAGGSVILTEVPEMFGAEMGLMDRCETQELFRKTVKLIGDFKEYFRSHGQTIYENPSPGNKKGGISTLEDKSLGCVQKSGSVPVRGVLSYGERIRSRGLNLLSAPGNDLVASTALAASGAQLILFTTGRGTPFAAPVPTMKISSNSALAQKKTRWIDFDCGPAAKGMPLEELGDRLFDAVIAVASGRRVKSEENGYHDMAIFKQGVTL